MQLRNWYEPKTKSYDYNIAMRTTLIVITVAAAMLVACSNKTSAPGAVSAQSSPAAKPADPVEQKLVDLAGANATDCGRLKTQAPDQTQKAGDCAMKAAKDKHPFYVAYDMPGLSIGIAGNSEGKLFSIQSEGSETSGAKPEVKSAPCPAELRIAQSGRVTCMTPGAGMGMGGNPHGGMGPASGENPHGGGIMNMPPLGTPNPHGKAQPSHPPASKTPPKQ